MADDVLAGAEDAAAEIARFDAEEGDALLPFSAMLLRSESAASSQIENLTASARAIAEAELEVSDRANATLILANVRAMTTALDLAQDLSGPTILAMHRALLAGSDPDAAGRWRTEQVWIGGGSIGPHQAVVVPPRHEHVGAAVADLVTFIRRDDLPILPQAAIAHAQFETVHPFTAGNGRTGRALLHAMLRNKGLSRNLTAPISAGLLADTGAYFAALTAYREGDLTPITRQVSSAVFAGLANGRQLLADLRAVRGGWSERVSARRNSGLRPVMDLLLRHPVVNAGLLARELGRSRTNVYGFLDRLENSGILVEFSDQKRGRVWGSPEVLAVLDAFATRATRRSWPT